MLLNIADRYYFVDNVEDWEYAATLYNRLMRRLSFVAGTTATSNLYKAYGYLAGAQVAFQPLSEIQSIYNTSKARLNQMRLGTDMFGHTQKWVPRYGMNGKILFTPYADRNQAFRTIL